MHAQPVRRRRPVSGSPTPTCSTSRAVERRVRTDEGDTDDRPHPHTPGDTRGRPGAAQQRRRGRARHDRPHPRLLGDPPQLGGLDGPLRGQGLPGARPRPTPASRSRSRRSTPTRRRSRRSPSRPSSTTSSPSSRDARPAADPHGPLGRRRFTQLLLDRGYGAVGVAINSAPTEGVRVVPLSQLKSTFAGAQEPGQPAPGRRVSPPSSGTTRSPTPSATRSRGRCTSATTIPASGRILWDSVLANFEPGPAGRPAVDYEQRRPGPAAVHLRRRGPPDAAEHPALQRQALQVATPSPR